MSAGAPGAGDEVSGGAPGVVDWDLAVATAQRFLKPGPEVSAAQAREVVAELREVAVAAVQPVAEVTGLRAPAGSATTVVVDRPLWVRSAVDGFRDGIGPLLNRAAEGRAGPRTQAVGARITGVQLGLALSFVASKVLGQYEAFTAAGAQPRLLLVAPNIRSVEQQLELEPSDFRLWVALHEETHRVQFGVAPWLGEHLLGEVEALLAVAGTGIDEVAGQLASGLRSVAGGGSLADLLQGPEQRAIVDRLTAVMSVLEGHADVVMDLAAPDLIASLPTIRSRFDGRRSSPGLLEGLVRRLLGLDAKLRQYTEGAAFVRRVVDDAGMEGLNVVWTGPSALPTLEEIHEPRQWLRRVGA